MIDSKANRNPHSNSPQVVEYSDLQHVPVYSTLESYSVPGEFAQPPNYTQPESKQPYSNVSIQSESKRIAGLKTGVFWLVIALVGLVVIGASVGGAVGGSMAMKGRDNNTATSSQSSAAERYVEKKHVIERMAILGLKI